MKKKNLNKSNPCRVNIKLYHCFKFAKMSAGGGAMTRGNQLLFGNGLATDAPRNLEKRKWQSE